MDEGWSACFWLDLRTGGLFPDEFTSGQEPASMFYFNSYKSSDREILLAGYDGYIRKFDESTKSDDGDNAIEGHFCIGPFVAEGEPRDIVDVREISPTLGEDSDGVTVSAYRAKSADEVIENFFDSATPEVSRTLSGDGLKNSVSDKVSGRAVAINISNTTAAETFSIEEVNVDVKIGGKEK